MKILLKFFLNLSRVNKRLISISIDYLIIVFVLIASFSLRYGEIFYPSSNLLNLILLAPFFGITIFYFFGLYKEIIRYFEFQALWAIIKAITLFSLFLGSLIHLSGISEIPRSVLIIDWILNMLLIGGSRIIGRWLFSEKDEKVNNEKKNVLIYGAGRGGAQLLANIAPSSEFNMVGFIDDDKNLKGQKISGLKVYGREEIENLVIKKNVDEIFLAMPSLNKRKIGGILDFLSNFHIVVKTLPSLKDLIEGRLKLSDLKKISVEDILGRDSVRPIDKYLTRNISNKVVMVTGAGGSIGSELARQILKLKPERVILFEISEYSLYKLESELEKEHDKNLIVPIIGSILDSNKTKHVINSYGVQTIYHAAAYKHVPMIEKNIFTGLMNNTIGTFRLAATAGECKVDTFVMISTDKAVRPKNYMGASKRMAEISLLALAQTNKEFNTNFSIVRFGNVLNSSGSVIPLFQEQIEKGGPITVTHKDMERYFMTIPEAAQLVIQAGAMSSGSDIFVLDMGEPKKIIDLAKKMINLSGLEVKNKENPDGDIEIIFCGLRPGEKLYEELSINGKLEKTPHKLIMKAEVEIFSETFLEENIPKLEKSLMSFNLNELNLILDNYVENFSSRKECQN